MKYSITKYYIKYNSTIYNSKYSTNNKSSTIITKFICTNYFTNI